MGSLDASSTNTSTVTSILKLKKSKSNIDAGLCSPNSSSCPQVSRWKKYEKYGNSWSQLLLRPEFYSHCDSNSQMILMKSIFLVIFVKKVRIPIRLKTQIKLNNVSKTLDKKSSWTTKFSWILVGILGAADFSASEYLQCKYCKCFFCAVSFIFSFL